MGPGDLDQALCGMDVPTDSNVLAGIGGSEDAGVYRLDAETALVQTVDFFTPIVDDYRVYGRAAAANSLSDIYAMGGRPITALNIVCWPTKTLGVEVLREVLAGGADAMREAGVVLLGGHSVEDDEPKYGLSVTGLVHPDRVMRNSQLGPGDRLVITKAVGTGIIATALKADLADPESARAMTASICELNKKACEVAVDMGIRAATDVTGFGLAGHLVEMALASGCRLTVSAGLVPVLPGALDAAGMGLVPAGAYANRNHFGRWIDMGPGLHTDAVDIMFDPQTSGGLILAVSPARSAELLDRLREAGITSAAEIGHVSGTSEEGRLDVW